MAFGDHKSGQTIWAILLIAMGVLLLVETPHALRTAPALSFLNFARYFIALFLIVGGLRKFYAFYFSNSRRSPKPKIPGDKEDRSGSKG